MIDFTIELLEDDRTFRNKVLKAMTDKINNAINKHVNKLRDDLANFTGSIFRQTETYHSLSDGKLAGHFGFFPGNGNKRAEAIIQAIQNSLFVIFRPIVPRAGYLDGELTINAVKSDLSQLLNLKSAEIVTPENGYILPWLDWLLLEGDRIIIADYRFEPKTGSGRSLKGLMIESNRAWRVPPEYAGTLRDNWITRTFDRDQQFIADSYAQIIDKHIDRYTR